MSTGGGKPKPGQQPAASVASKKSDAFRNQLTSSGFDKNDRGLETMLGRAKSVELDADEAPASVEFYDGQTPAPEVVDSETWRPVKAPVQSRPRRRTGRLLWMVIDQFAVAHNPRFAVSETAVDPRAHIFAWDVSLAMDCEIPHHRSGRELTLGQTIDWLRFESLNEGWRRADADGAMAAADRGELALVIPKDPKHRALAIVRPGGPGEDGRPRVASAGRPCGGDLSVEEAVGRQVEYFFHV